MLLFSVFMIKLEAWGKTKTQRTQAFHILVPSFFSWCEEYNLLLPLLRNGCTYFLIDYLYSGVSIECYLNQYTYFRFE